MAAKIPTPPVGVCNRGIAGQAVHNAETRSGVLSWVIRALNKYYYTEQAETTYAKTCNLGPQPCNPPRDPHPHAYGSSVRYEPGSMATREVRTTAAWLRMRLTTNDYTRAPNMNVWRRRVHPCSSLQPAYLPPACGRARVSRRTCSIAAGTRRKCLQRSTVCAVAYHALRTGY